MEYVNFDLRIEPGTPYRVAVDSVVGEFDGVLNLDIGDPEFAAALARIQQRRTDRAFLAQFGDALYRSLFHDRIAAGFERCTGYVLAENKGLRVRLRISVPELAAVPWELLHEPTRDFLATSEQNPVVRWLRVAKPIRNLVATPPLRVLVAIPEPLPPFPPLQVDREVAGLREALSRLAADVEMTVLKGTVSLSTIDHALIDNVTQVFHFIGHAEFGEHGGRLLLNGEDGGMAAVGEAEFARLFVDHRDLKLVVLNACEGARISPESPFLGIAPNLVRLGIPAVVAMQYSILDEAAIAFAREFYFALFRGPNAGRIDWAISHARNALARDFPDQREQAAPVLFLRAPEGLLFYLDSGSRMRDAALSRDAVDSERAAAATHRFNQALADDAEARREPDLTATLASDLDDYRRLKARIAFRNRLVIGAAACAVVVVCLSWVRLFDAFRLDTLVEGLTYVAADMFAEQPRLRDEIRIVLDPAPPTWRSRSRHAELVDRLAAAGAKVIAFDFFFLPGEPSADPQQDTERRQATQDFADSIRRAAARGTAVVLGFDRLGEGRPTIAQALGEAAGAGRLGHVCLSGKLGYVGAVPVVIRTPDGIVRPSLALASYVAATSAPATRIEIDDRKRDPDVVLLTDTASIRLAYSKTRVSPGTPCAANPEGSTDADLFLDISPVSVMRQSGRSATYDAVLEADPAWLAGQFADAVVFVGTEADRLKVFDVVNGRRYGAELHAGAFNAIASVAEGATPIRSAPFSWQTAVLAAMVALGSGIRFWLPRQVPSWRRIALAVVIVGYGVVALQLFAGQRLLLDSVYHLVALGLSYWLAGRIEQRWMA